MGCAMQRFFINTDTAVMLGSNVHPISFVKDASENNDKRKRKWTISQKYEKYLVGLS